MTIVMIKSLFQILNVFSKNFLEWLSEDLRIFRIRSILVFVMFCLFLEIVTPLRLSGPLGSVPFRLRRASLGRRPGTAHSAPSDHLKKSRGLESVGIGWNRLESVGTRNPNFDIKCSTYIDTYHLDAVDI